FPGGCRPADFRKGLDDDHALWSLECEVRGVSPGEGRPMGGSPSREPSAPAMDPGSLAIPGGAMEPGSPFYIERPADKETIGVVFRPRGMAAVRGPRQTGKSSLIARVYDRAGRAAPPHRTALIDFQSFQPPDFQTLDAIWKAIIVRVAENLGLDDKWGPDAWKPQSTCERNITRFLDRGVFSENPSPLLICIDEVDRAFQIPVSGAFFSTLRSFYNRGATDPAWKRVRWLLGASSEPELFITDRNQSPFNVGVRVELTPFTRAQVNALALSHGLTLSEGQIDRIIGYIGGRPYLTHLLLYHWALSPSEKDRLFDVSTAGGGVFLGHLRRYLIFFQEDRDLAEAMKAVIREEGCKVFMKCMTTK
ncbi:MAG: AAA family ATPase, partial [Desulfobacterales bacterium]|nr:AAA family ATPase [Desulfobacterales bacterium]